MDKGIRFWNHIKKHAVFYLILLVTILCVSIRKIPGNNDYEIAICAKHFFNSDWISCDWFLSQNIGFRLLAYFVIGPLANLFSIFTAVLISRILVAFLVSIVMQKFARLMDIKAYVLVTVYLLFIEKQSLVAGEWFLGSFESKVLAYIFFFLAIIYAVEKKPWKAIVFAGLTLSSHVLVGTYALFSLGVAFLIEDHRVFKTINLKQTLKAIGLFVVTSILGLYAYWQFLNVSDIAEKGNVAYIYVMLRSPHHLLPYSFTGFWWIIITLLAIILYIYVLTNYKRRIYNYLAYSALTGLCFFTIGIIIYLSGNYEYLRYYWFRFADTYVPFSSMLLIASLSSIILDKGELLLFKFITSKKWFRKMIKTIYISLFIFLMFLVVYEDITYIGDLFRTSNQKFSRVDSQVADAFLWISENTPEDAVFLIEPRIAEYFYYLAERPLFVSFKHAPQYDKNVLEWYERIKLCNRGKELIPKEGLKVNLPIIKKSFYTLTRKEIVDIARNYNISYYLDKKDRLLDFQIVYENEEYRLYKIEN